MKPSSGEIISTRRKYKVVWDREALEAARFVVKQCNHQEVQWFHFVDRYYDEKANLLTYYISDIVIPEQTVSGTTVESDAKMMLNLIMELKERHNLMVRDADGKLTSPKDENGERIPPDEESLEKFNRDCKRMAVWCHSHVKMACNPSGTDNEQWADLIRNKITESDDSVPVMMYIFNQNDECFSRLYDPALGAEVQNATFCIDDGFDFDSLGKLIKERIKTKPIVQSSSGYTGQYTGQNNSSNFQQGYQQSQAGTHTKGGTSTTTDTPSFKISFISAKWKELLNVSEDIYSTPPPQVTAVVDKFMQMVDPFFGDSPTVPHYNYCWHILNSILFNPEKEGNRVIDLYRHVLKDEDQKKYENARKEFRVNAITKYTVAPEALPIAVEVAFGYTLSQRMHNLGTMMNSDWITWNKKAKERADKLEAEIQALIKKENKNDSSVR